MSNPEDLSEELTDQRLDTLLDEAGVDLLQHIQATTHTNDILLGLMTADQDMSLPDQQSLVEAVIAVRARIRDLIGAQESAQNRARDLAGYLSTASNRAGSFDCTFDRGVVLSVVRALASALACADKLNAARDLVRVRILDLVRVLDAARTVVREPARDLDDYLASSVALDLDLTQAQDVIRNLDIARCAALAGDSARARAAALALARAADCIPALSSDLSAKSDALSDHLRRFAEQQVDASGADMSRTDVTDLSLLTNVIWTDSTRWPIGAEPRIRAHSRELVPGVYQVHAGTEREDADINTW
ncbi:hypothetical protein [Streptomyces mirabilis]